MMNDKSFLRVSDNGHYFVKDGAPFFWLGDSLQSAYVWYTLEELEYYFKKRKQQGFTIVHTTIPFDGAAPLGFERSDLNVEGEPVWLNMDPTTPNEAYFRFVDKVIRLANEHGIMLAVNPLGGSGGTYVAQKKIFNKENTRIYAKWLAERYKNEPNIVWKNGFDMRPWEYEEVARALVEGLIEGDGGSHLILYHPAGCFSSNHFHHEEWLAANIIQTWSSIENIHIMVQSDYFRKPHKPIIMGEGAYEAGTEYPNRPITPWKIRQQAYWSFLSGGFFTYGHNDMWRKATTWKDAIDAPGAKQMTILKDIFTSLEWWKLVPDQTVLSGYEYRNVAARSSDGDWAMAYISSRETIEADMSKITAADVVDCEWINPQNGERRSAGYFPNTGMRSFTVPAQFEDAILLMRAK